VLPALSPPVNAVSDADGDALPHWEACCKSLGLLVTAPRRAILMAMLRTDQTVDAVTLLQAAREHHAGTSIGTVYRFLRELEQLGLVRTLTQPHSRCRWHLSDSPQGLPDASVNIRLMLRQVQSFLRDLEKLGFAEAMQMSRHTVTTAALGQAKPTAADPSIDTMREIAERLGYRLA
jgi:Fe2+ or Zn2+ uptake regulation protein